MTPYLHCLNETAQMRGHNYAFILSIIRAEYKREYLIIDGWMTCDLSSFSTVFQSYQDDERLLMKGCVQWSSVYG